MGVIGSIGAYYAWRGSGGEPVSAQSSPLPDTPATRAAGIKIGLSFPDFGSERWKNDAELMTKLLEQQGYAVIIQEAAHDVKLQNDQIDHMVSQGVEGLIVIAEDGYAVASAVDRAVKAGVKVIAYDRLIMTAGISAYISFDSVEVGRQQALGVLTALGIPGGDQWTKNNPAKIVLSGGSPTDNNAIRIRQGQISGIETYLDEGIVRIVADQWVDNWNPATAERMMENILTAQQNQIDGVIASNDGTALAELEAMRAQGLAGTVPISGQDATADGCNSIVKGELTVTVFKDIRLLASKAVTLLVTLLKGENPSYLRQYTIAELTVDSTRTGSVMVDFLPVVAVTKDNVYEVVVKSCFQPYDDVYRDIPDGERPPRVSCD
ncbi:MAG: substrate-binding domain-containing protein [Anaerolineales bacterium]|nr:substrate-binding domain-containing protein [Anaerolineales bacterium]